VGITNYELQITDWKTIVALAAIVLIAGIIFSVLSSPLDSYQEVVIKEGQGVTNIAEILQENGIINNKLIFIIYTLITGNEKRLQAGRYLFPPRATVPVIVYSMSQGFAESDDLIITIPEGFNVLDIDRRLVSVGLIKEGEFAQKYYQNEGQFFPDTYRIENQNGPFDKTQDYPEQSRTDGNVKIKNSQEIIKEIGEKMAANFIDKAGNISKEDLIVASILEKEAKTESDMRLIAGIIKKRLELGMLLQIDATVAYGACLRDYRQSAIDNEPFKYCDVSQVPIGAEIKIDGPYNTYTRTGLPPGPIASPGVTTIKAALNPIQSDYLYYLSTRDGGQIIFSKTAVEHVANRRKYLGL